MQASSKILPGFFQELPKVFQDSSKNSRNRLSRPDPRCSRPGGPGEAREAPESPRKAPKDRGSSKSSGVQLPRFLLTQAPDFIETPIILPRLSRRCRIRPRNRNQKSWKIPQKSWRNLGESLPPRPCSSGPRRACPLRRTAAPHARDPHEFMDVLRLMPGIPMPNSPPHLRRSFLWKIIIRDWGVSLAQNAYELIGIPGMRRRTPMSSWGSRA